MLGEAYTFAALQQGERPCVIRSVPGHDQTFQVRTAHRAAAIKKIASPIAGRANVLIVPDLEAGNMLAKILVALARRTALSKAVG